MASLPDDIYSFLYIAIKTLKLQVTLSDWLFCQTNNLNPQNIQCMIKYFRPQKLVWQLIDYQFNKLSPIY